MKRSKVGLSTGALIGVASIAGLKISAQGAVLSAFTPNDLVIYEVSSSAALTSAGTAVSLAEFDTSGNLQGTLAMPTVGSGSNNPLVSSGTATSEGNLSLSANGQYLVLTGYDAAVGTTGVASTASSSVPRVIGTVDAFTNIDTSTTTTSFTGNNIRSAASVDGTGFWAAGATTGIVYTPLGGSGAGTVVSSTVTNLRAVNIFGNQLYVSTASGSAIRLASVGTGTPTTAGQAMTELPGVTVGTNAGSSSAGTEVGGPYEYWFANLGGGSSYDTLYIADNGNGGTNSSTSGTIDKYVLSGGTWTAEGTVALVGLSGIAGETVTVGSNTVEELFATTPTNLYELTDSAGAGALAGTPTSIASAGTDTAFRGIALAPVPEPTGLAILGLAGMGLIRRRKMR